MNPYSENKVFIPTYFFDFQLLTNKNLLTN